MLGIHSKLAGIAKSWIFWLIVATGIAIILRSLPAWTNAAWGNDFGIYYGLTNSFVESGELINDYVGWGNSYQYFPVLYTITGIVHWITGIDVLVLMPKIIPIFGGLTIFIFYFIVKELVGSKKIAIISSLFLAVLPFHVYQTSHAAPLTMGHFFMMLSIYFFIKSRQKVKFLIPLLISTMLLIMSHHLTTYFYLISLIFIVFVENVSKRQWTPSIKLDMMYIVTTSALIFSYWASIATPVYERFMNLGLKIGPLSVGANFMIVLFYLLIFSMLGIVWLKRRYNLSFENIKIPWKSPVFEFALAVILCSTVMVIYTFINLPGTNFSFTPLSIVYALPLLIIFGFGVAGYRRTRFIKNGFFIRGWVLAILVSFAFGMWTNNPVILPHRHLEYLMMPLSIISAYGIIEIFSHIHYKSLFDLRKRSINVQKSLTKISGKRRFILDRKQLLYLALIVIIITTNAASTYSLHSALNVTHEGISHENFSVANWVNENLDKNNSVIASDHRISRIVESAGFNTTRDDAIFIWEAENLTDYIDELFGINMSCDIITHVIIDDVMREQVVSPAFREAYYMTNNSYNKFHDQPFELVYRNATLDNQMKEVHWTEIYEVNWTYIEELSLE